MIGGGGDDVMGWGMTIIRDGHLGNENSITIINWNEHWSNVIGWLMDQMTRLSTRCNAFWLDASGSVRVDVYACMLIPMYNMGFSLLQTTIPRCMYINTRDRDAMQEVDKIFKQLTQHLMLYGWLCMCTYASVTYWGRLVQLLTIRCWWSMMMMMMMMTNLQTILNINDERTSLSFNAHPFSRYHPFKHDKWRERFVW